jgi:hypothetical protein
MKFTCGQCHFFSSEGEAGACHGNPPKLVVIETKTMPGEEPDEMVTMFTQRESLRPTVDADDIACRHYQEE